MQKIQRIARILFILWRYDLFSLLRKALKPSPLTLILFPLSWFSPAAGQPRAKRIHSALEALGPVFIKFGQVLSTRRDLLPDDIAIELAKLQDDVTPFSQTHSREIIEKALGLPIDSVFEAFDAIPVASASIAQVHFAVLKSTDKNPEWAGKSVAIKVLRPNILPVIESDLALMHMLARMIEKYSYDGKRLKPREVVEGFDTTFHDELDLLREASNCSQLKRNFEGSDKIMIPEIYWDLCHINVMVMERMHGISIGRIDDLKAAGVDLKKLAREGVEVFFKQAFAHGFFHADMHPGNIYVSDRQDTLGRYIALDFGIVGSLSEFDKNYLAQNFLAFFQRDYRRVARLHIESGWVPANTREEELEAAVRAVCEPYFDRPLAEISLGQVLLRLFQMSRRFNVQIQPQLVLLQKTLLNVEGLGRELDPRLDLWLTAKPYLERWMHERMGLRGLRKKLSQEASQWAQLLPEFPRLMHQRLNQPELQASILQELRLTRLARERGNRLLFGLSGLVLVGLVCAAWLYWHG